MAGKPGANPWGTPGSERYKQRGKEWREANAKQLKCKAKLRYQKNKEKILKRLSRPEMKLTMAERARQRNRRLREEFIKEYGGKCECCGESQWQFLSLEHKNGDGAEHRKRVRSSAVIYDLKKQGWPKDKYGILCFNCNLAQGFHGFCHAI